MSGATRRPLSLGSLRAFEAVGQRLNFTGAAQSLCVSQSAISRHIISLEALLGGDPVEVALEPGRRDGEEVARAGAAQGCEHVRNPARREQQRARAGVQPLVAERERQLALEHVERLVEVVVMQRRPSQPAGTAFSTSAT